MNKIVYSAFCCSLVFFIYIWTWLSWYTWLTVKEKRLERFDSGKNKNYLHNNHYLRKDEREEAVHQNSQSLNRKSCLESSKMYGAIPSHIRFLTIGIPSVNRKKSNYLFKTLKSLVKNQSENEENNVTIIVLFGDSDGTERNKRANATRKQFQKEVDSGLILLIEPMWEFYPKVKITRRTFNDSLERIQWRSKQVLDFAFLFHCGQGIAEYFLILEDDVETSPGYVNAIKKFVTAKQNQDWVSLTFSGFFIIGRLLRNADLTRLSQFLVMFYLEKPVDLLIIQFLDLLVQDRYTVTRRVPGLFQHIGLFSSLDGKIQKARDRSFSSNGHFQNPTADIVTTLGVYKKHFPEYGYDISPDKFFWGSAPKVNDTFDIILHKPMWLKSLVILSGHKSHKNDLIRYAKLKLSPSFNKMISNSKADCSHFQTATIFHEGIVNMTFNDSSQVVQCIRIEFVKKHANWILIREITISSKNN